MSKTSIALALIAILQAQPIKAEELHSVSLLGGVGACYPPEEPFPFKLDKQDPLYETARDEHQRYLEGMEDYINCLDRERVDALAALTNSFNLFRKNLGKDGAFKYSNHSRLGQ